MMLASCNTSRRALSCVMRQDRTAASARPTTKATNITRLNLPFRPIRVAPPGMWSLSAADQFRRLFRAEPAGHRRAQFVLIAADRGTRVWAEQAVHLAVVVAKLAEQLLDQSTIAIGHLLIRWHCNGSQWR